MAITAKITNNNTGITYEVRNFLSYDISQSLYIPADSFNLTLGNKSGEISKLITSGDEISCYIGSGMILNGIIDDINFGLNMDSNDIIINGRDKVSILMDNEMEPKTYSKIGLRDFIKNVVSSYGFSKINIASNPKIDKIQISAGDSPWTPIFNYCKDYNLFARYDKDTITADYLKSSTTNDYLFSNDIKNAIRYESIDILLSSANIKNKVIVYSDSYDSKDNIKASATDTTLKIKRTKVSNEPDIENSAQGSIKAKQILNENNRDSFKITLRIYTNQVIDINKIARLYIPKLGLDCILLVEEVHYSKTFGEGSVTTVKLGLVEGIQVKWQNHDIPTLFKIR